MQLVAIAKLIDKIINVLFYFLDKKEKEEQRREIEQIEKDPVDWFNGRYSNGVQSTDTEADSTDDSKTNGGSGSA